MESLTANAAKIIKEAAASPLGLMALVVMAMSGLTWGLFRDTSQIVRLVVFLALLASAGAFVTALLRSGAARPELAGSDASGTSESPKLRMRTRQRIHLVQAGAGATERQEAIVIEEDSFFVLGAPKEATPTRERPREVLRETDDGYPKKMGSVIVRGSGPVRMHAVVHDMELQPTWKEEWIAAALSRVLEEARDRRLESIGLPLMGVRYGLDSRRSAELLATVLSAHPEPPVQLTVFVHGEISSGITGTLAPWLRDS